MDVESALNAPTRLQTDNRLCAIALHALRRHECSLISPKGQSEWRDRGAETEGRAEGKIKGGGTRRAVEWRLHKGCSSTRRRGVRAARGANMMATLALLRAVYATVRLELISCRAYF